MRHVGLAVVLASAGCNSILGIGDLSLADGGAGDGPPDAGFCLGTLVSRCTPEAPTGEVHLDGMLDTTADPRCVVTTQSGGPELCVIAADSITIDVAGLVAFGTRPLMLIGASTVTVVGTLDVGSRRGMKPGAGANSMLCAVPAIGGDETNAGGGAGGSFGGKGGNGGVGGGIASEGGTGGNAALPQAVSQLRGGCPGGAGGRGNNGAGTTPGDGGAGGGAVYLVAGTSIGIQGGIQASGAGGGGASNNSSNCAGGGAGSGGLIALEAPMINVTGPLVANGGAGGEGAGDNDDGSTGADGNVFNVAAVCTPMNTKGGDGGAGSALGLAATSGIMGSQGTGQNGGGGGGGGGAGVIRIKGTLMGGTMVSPAPLMMQ